MKNYKDYLIESTSLINESSNINWKVIFPDKSSENYEKSKLDNLSNKLIKSVSGNITDVDSDITIIFNNGDSIKEFYKYSPFNDKPADVTLSIDKKIIKDSQNDWENNYMTNYDGIINSLVMYYLSVKLGIKII